MQILRPNQTFRILWVTADPNDATTYFPRVTVKSTLSGDVLLSAQNLALDSAGRYYYDWIVPGDTNGGGLQIDMTITVYTDSGHTALSQNYSRENRVYNIFDLAALMRGGNGGNSFDENYLVKLIKKELAEAIPDHTESFAHMGSMMQEHRGLLSSLVAGGNGTAEVLAALSRLPRYDAALENITKLIDVLSDKHQSGHSAMLEGLQNLAETLGEFKDNSESILDLMKDAADIMRDMPSTVTDNISGLSDKIKQSEKIMQSILRALSSIETVTVHTGLPMPDSDVPPPAPPKDYSRIARQLAGQ